MRSERCRWEELGHTAEIGVRVWAPTWSELFACVAQALTAVGESTPDPSRPPVTHTLAIAADDAESLLVDWLSELLYLQEVTGCHLEHFAIAEVSQTALTAVVTGRPLATPPRVHVKAVTYHQLRVAPVDGGWLAEVFFDI